MILEIVKLRFESIYFLLLFPQSKEVSLGTKEVRDLTRIERIGAHSHVRGLFLVKFLSYLTKVTDISLFAFIQVLVLTMHWSQEKSRKVWLAKRLLVKLVVWCIK